MSVGHTDPLPSRCSRSLGAFFGRSRSITGRCLTGSNRPLCERTGGQAGCRACRRITPSQAELNAIIAKNPRPGDLA